MARSPLAGKRVLVTRAKEQAGKTAALLRDRGAEPVILPTIEIVAPRDAGAVTRALGRAGEYAWVVFTSANGVEWTWRALEAGGNGPEVFARARIAVVGPRTAEAALERGLRAEVVAVESKGEGLAASLLGAMKPGERVLLLRALVARDVLPKALRAAGHEVDIVAVYETRPPPGDEVERVARELAAGAIDAVTFTSGSTVDNFVALLGGGGAGGEGDERDGEKRARELLGRTLVCSIGPVTSAALAEHGIPVAVTAREATLASLLDALEQRFGRTVEA